MRVTGTRGVAANGAIPILLGVNRKEFAKDLANPHRKGKALYVGAPFHLTKQRHDYLVTPVALLRDDFVLRNVRTVRERIRAEFQTIRQDGGDTWDYWLNSRVWRGHRTANMRTLFKYQYVRGYRWEDIWSLMILDWLFQGNDPYAEAYFSGDMHLAVAWGSYLGIEVPQAGYSKSINGFYKSQLVRGMLDGSKANVSIDLATWVDMKDAYESRIKALREIGDVYEAYARIWLFIFSVFVGAAPSFAIRVLGEALFGYIDFVIELYNAEKDGVITDEEYQGAWIALIGLFLPMASYLGKAGQIATTVLSIGLLAVAIILALISSLIQVLGKLDRVESAADNQFINYVESNPEMQIFIPAQV